MTQGAAEEEGGAEASRALLLASYPLVACMDSYWRRRYNGRSGDEECAAASRIEESFMQRVASLALMVGLVAAMAGRTADDRETALRVVQQAIQAHGGEDRLARTKFLVRDAKGVISLNKDVPFTTKLSIAFPERFRDVIEADQLKLTRVLNGDQGWQAGFGATMEMPKEEVADLREELYVLWLMTLLPLKDSAFELSSLPDAPVEGRPASGVQVVHKGRPDIKLYFDKQTNRLVKIQREARVAGLVGKKEYVFGDFRELQGITLPTRQIEYMEGKKLTTLTINSYDFPDRLDDSLFTKP